MADEHGYQTVAVEEIEHAGFGELYHFLPQLFGAEMNVNEILHVLDALLLNIQVGSNLAVDAVSSDQILALDFITTITPRIPRPYQNPIPLPLNPHAPRIVPHGFWIYPLVQLFGEAVLAKVVREGVGESADVLHNLLTTLSISNP